MKKINIYLKSDFIKCIYIYIENKFVIKYKIYNYVNILLISFLSTWKSLFLVI